MGRGERRPLGELAQRVNAQVKAELARRDLPLTTGLDDVLGSHNYAFQRIKGRIALDLNDVERIAKRFEMTPLELIGRAVDEAAAGLSVSQSVSQSADRLNRNADPLEDHVTTDAHPYEDREPALVKAAFRHFVLGEPSPGQVEMLGEGSDTPTRPVRPA